MSHDLHNIVRDALRYRELRKHRNRGYPQRGIPYVCGWGHMDEERGLVDIGHIREGQLDSDMDELFEQLDLFDEVDKLVVEITQELTGAKDD